jgi:hypothetical protein
LLRRGVGDPEVVLLIDGQCKRKDKLAGVLEPMLSTY